MSISGSFNHFFVAKFLDVALYKLATQSSTYDGCDPFRGVDGNTKNSYSDNTCFHTNDEQSPWWQVNFGKSFTIVGVELTNRGDCCGDRLKQFKITVDGQLYVIQAICSMQTSAFNKFPLLRKDLTQSIASFIVLLCSAQVKILS